MSKPNNPRGSLILAKMHYSTYMRLQVCRVCMTLDLFVFAVVVMKSCVYFCCHIAFMWLFLCCTYTFIVCFCRCNYEIYMHFCCFRLRLQVETRVSQFCFIIFDSVSHDIYPHYLLWVRCYKSWSSREEHYACPRSDEYWLTRQAKWVKVRTEQGWRKFHA